MKVCLVRHGETAWTLSGQHTGLADLALTARGDDESRAFAPRLLGLAFTQVLVSPRLRARQNCELAGFAMASELVPDLSEWDCGHYEGLRSDDIRRDRPNWNIWRDGCPGGESAAGVSARAYRLIARLATMQGMVALFTHGHFGVALAVRWIGLMLVEGQHFALNTASVSLLGIQGHHADRHCIELWNELPCRQLEHWP